MIPKVRILLILGISIISCPFLVAVENTLLPPETDETVSVFHVHTDFSYRSPYTLQKIGVLARKYGIDVVFLTDHLLSKWEYRPPLLGAFFRVIRNEKSVMEEGVGKYLSSVRRYNENSETPLIIPGFELAPEYWWESDLFGLSFTIHDWQKNMLVTGLFDEDKILGLPVMSNPEYERFSVASVLLLLPVMLIPFGLILIIRSFRIRPRIKYYFLKRFTGGGLFLIGVIAFILNFPFTINEFTPSSESMGNCSYQRTIDYVSEKGGVSIWAHPGSPDRGEISMAGGMIKIKTHTDPYLKTLENTTGWDGFAGLLQGNVDAAKPGRIWDKLLTEYCKGNRAKAPFATGNIIYHYEGQAGSIYLFQVKTVFFGKLKTPEELLRSLRQGRFYAVRQSKPDSRLVLLEFAIKEIEREGQGTVKEIQVKVAASGGEDMHVMLDLIKGGVGIPVAERDNLLRSEELRTPFEFKFIDSQCPKPGRYYYRIKVTKSNADYILSNPMFFDCE